MMRRNWSLLVSHPWLDLLAMLLLAASLPLLPEALIWPGRVVMLVLCLAIGARIVAKLRNPQGNLKPAVFAVMALLTGLVLSYGLLELGSWIYQRKAPLSGDPFVMTERQKQSVQAIIDGAMRYVVHSPTLGATIGKSQTSADGLYRSNADGIRGDREYTKEKPPGKLRVLCFGDSYTHGDEVANHETWAHHAEQAAPEIEFLNFGVPGYGLTQAYLRYKEAASQYAADYVIIGCMTEDVKRGVNVYFPFRFANPQDGTTALALPYAALDDKGKLVLHPPPMTTRDDYAAFLKNPRPMLKKMAKADILFRPQPPTPFSRLLADRWERLDGRLDHLVDHALDSWSLTFNSRGLHEIFEGSEAAQKREMKAQIAEVGRQLFERFALEVEANGSAPLVVWFPSPTNLDRHNEGKPRDYGHFIEHIAGQGIAVADTLDWLQELAGPGQPLPVESFLGRNHFSAPVNAHIGKRLAEFIRRLDRTPRPG